MQNAIIASTSTVYGERYLEYLLPYLEELFSETTEVLFIPYARPGGLSHQAYTQLVEEALEKIGKKVKGIHQFEDPVTALFEASGIFTGGGNTFVLVDQLYQQEILEPLRKAIHSGVPYLGTSAGSNICGLTMQTTNDMPIAYPPSFKTLGILPFNINPHYLDPLPNSKHMGETRETRIKEFHSHNNIPVLGLREGGWIRLKRQGMTLEGSENARLFVKNTSPRELPPGSDLSFLH